MVGLIPLFAVETFEPEDYGRLTGFCKRMQWFLDHNPDVREHVDMSRKTEHGAALAAHHRRIAKSSSAFTATCSTKTNFYRPHGIRALSKFHAANPFVLSCRWTAPAPSITSPPNRPAIFSAEIPIGADPSGFR